MAISNTQLTDVVSNLYVSSGTTVVSVMYFCNTNTTPQSFSLWAVPSGGTAGDSNQIYKNVQVAPADTFVVDMEKLVLATGDMIQGNATANSSITSTFSFVSM